MMFAEVDPSTGWFSVLLQGGSFAVLVYLLIVGLPKAAREATAARAVEHKLFLDELKDKRDKFVIDLKEQRASFTESLDKVTRAFKEEAAAERLSCEKHFSTLADSMAKGNEVTIQAVKTILQQIQSHAERNQQWLEVLKNQLEVERSKQRQE